MTVPQKDIVLNDTSDYVFQSTRIQRRHIHVVTIFELLQNVDLCVLKKKNAITSMLLTFYVKALAELHNIYLNQTQHNFAAFSSNVYLTNI